MSRIEGWVLGRGFARLCWRAALVAFVWICLFFRKEKEQKRRMRRIMDGEGRIGKAGDASFGWVLNWKRSIMRH